MADLIPFPRGNPRPLNTDERAWISQMVAEHGERLTRVGKCSNGMPGHPPCRSPAELEAMLRAQGDTTAAREGV